MVGLRLYQIGPNAVKLAPEAMSNGPKADTLGLEVVNAGHDALFHSGE